MNVKSLLLGVFAAVSLAAAADVDLKNAVIVHPENPVGWETPAVEDMKTALEKMTGRKYQVFPEGKAPSAGVKIYIGNTRAAKAEGIDPQKLESQEFRMKAGNGKVFLIGGSPTGTSYAVSTFLQTQFGVYCLAADCFVYPKNAAPKVKDLDKTQKPDFANRVIYTRLDRSFERGTQKKWLAFNRINRFSWSRFDRLSPTLGRCHTFYKLVPPQKYFKDHPEYYSMRENGQRDWHGRGQLCLSNPEVRKVVLKELLALIKKERKKNPNMPPTIYTVGPEDGTSFFLCHCPECKARVNKGGSSFVLVADLVNYVAREVRKVYPDIRILTGINGKNDNPDVEFTLEKNVIFFHADRGTLSNYMYPLSDPMNRKGYRYLLEWRRKSPALWFWDYWWMPTNCEPVVAVDAIIADIRLLRDLKVMSVQKETEFIFNRNTFLTFHLLQVWLEAQLMFDASQDPEKLINDFMDGYYGAAAPEMKAYLALIRKAQKEKRTPLEDFCKGENRHTAHISKDFIDQSYALAKKGLEKVRNDKQLAARVSWELINITHCGFRYYRDDPAKYKQLQDEYKAAVLLNLEVLHLKPELEAKVKEILAAELSVAEGVKFDDLPPELAKLPASQLVAVPFKYQKGHAPANVRRVADPESSQPKSLARKPFGSQVKNLMPVFAGVHCLKSRKTISIQIKKAPEDEKYHWYKIGTFSIELDSFIYAGGWYAKLLLKDFYTAPTGKGPDPNRYEVWVSIRLQGPGYVPGSTRETALFLDRGLLVRKP